MSVVKKTNKRLWAKFPGTLYVIFLIFFCSSALLALTPAPSYSDAKSPPDESINREEVKKQEAEEQQKKDEAARIARQKRAAEAQRRAEAARKKAEAAKKTQDAKLAKEAAQRAASQDIIMRALSVGQNLVENGRYRSAVHLLEGFLAEHQDSTDAWYWISRAYHALGDYDKAQYAVNRALYFDPYYPALVKTPNGLQPMPRLTKQQRKEPRPSMSVLPVKQPMPANLLLEPVVISFPILVEREFPEEGDFVNSLGEPDGYDPITGAYLEYVPYPPHPLGATVRWMQSEKFNEISRWRFRVDRIGILMEPRVPIAWKGSNPYEIYFWTGDEWARVRRERSRFDERERYDDILYRAQDSIAEVLRDRGFVWYEPDTPSLAANASLMRYKWVGDVDTMDAESRAIKRASIEATPGPTTEERERMSREK
ncbi:MAG: tetratricopeptide repeat protein [Synergistaceae bacterium]|nr:tetratricopeptide repeat protein [Synergistaceae bacterium]